MDTKRFLFGMLTEKKRSVKLAYIAVLLAGNVAVNAITSIPLGFVQFSFTLSAVALAGILLGPLFGFAVGFLGDLVGFFIGGGAGYTPFVGLAMGLVAFLYGAAFCLRWQGKWAWCIKVAVAAVLSFLLATVAISTTAGFFLWNKSGLPFWEFAVARLFVGGQVWNNVINTALLYAVLPALSKIPIFKLEIEKK